MFEFQFYLYTSAREWILFLLSLKILWGLLHGQVLETARQVASFSTSSTPLPYDQMKNQCEALVTGKQQKMSVIHSFKHQQKTKAIVLSSKSEVEVPPLPFKVRNFYKIYFFSIRKVYVMNEYIFRMYLDFLV